MSSADLGFDELVENAVNGIKHFKGLTDEERREWYRSNGPIPPTLSIGDGRQYPITKEGLAAVYGFGKLWRKNSSSIRSSISEDQAAELARIIFGEALGGRVLPNHSASTPLKDLITDLLNERLQLVGRPTWHYFPCQIFDEANIQPFSVGPVIFKPRSEWMEHVEAVAGFTPPWFDEVRLKWNPKNIVPDIEQVNITAAHQSKQGSSFRYRSYDEWVAHDITDTFSHSNWIGMVEVSGREYQRSRECAKIVVRVALDAVALPLDRRSAIDIRGPEDEMHARILHEFSQFHGKDVQYNSRLDVPRLKGAQGTNAKFLQSTSNLRTSAGNALKSFVEPTFHSSRHGLYLRWIEAMYWFGQARRESTEFIGLVKAGICLDILAKGSKKRGIVQLCSNLFGLTATKPFLTNGTSLEKLVNQIYDEGRSQLSHGGRLAILQDLPVRRDLACEFTSMVLQAYIDRLENYVGMDQYEAFLQALPALTPKKFDRSCSE